MLDELGSDSMRYTLILLCIFVFLLTTGCGLIPMTQMTVMDKQHYQSNKVAVSKKQSDKSRIHNERLVEQSSNSHLFARLNHPLTLVAISTDITKNKRNGKKDQTMSNAKGQIDISVTSSQNGQNSNHGNGMNDSSANSNNTTNNGTTGSNSSSSNSDSNSNGNSGSGSNSDSDPKYEAAQQKAAKLQNTDQKVTADQANIYDQPVETSNVVDQVFKGQVVHVSNTQVDKDDDEIWCNVTGNDGSKDFSGWISYNDLQ